MTYFNEGDPVPHDENPSWDPAGVSLKAHFQAAKTIWENLLPGSGSYDFEFEWDNDLDPGQLGLTSPDLLSPGDWIIELNSDSHWFADPTPSTDEEFETTPTRLIYETLSPADQATYFPAASPPLALETGFALVGIAGTTGSGGYDSSNGYDLLSVILHEIGHVLAINSVLPGDWPLDPQHLGGSANVSVLGTFAVPGGSHLAGSAISPGFLMNPATPTGGRILPSATDVLAIAADQGINNVHLARVDRISSGNWNNTNAWIGADVPDATQDAYVAQAGAVTLDVNASVKSLNVRGGGSVDATGFQLASAGDIRFDGGAITAGAGSVVRAEALHGDPASLTTVAGSAVEFNNFTRGASSATAATFNGNVRIGVGAGTSLVTFNPDPTITSWTVGQNLAVGDVLHSAQLVIDNGQWNVGGALDMHGTVMVDAGVFVPGSGFTGGQLNVTGPVTVGGVMTYRGSDASNTTYSIAGGRSTRMTNPPPTHLFVTSGAEMTFEDTSTSSGDPIGGRANSGTFNVNGGAGDGGPGASLTFKGHSDALYSHIVNAGGIQGDALSGTRAGFGGVTRFEGSATAASADIRNEAVVADQGGSGGLTVFADAARAGNSSLQKSTINNYGATTFASRASGSTEFRNSASASFANITNHPTNATFVGDNATAPRTTFYGISTAGDATITNKGSVPGFIQGGRTFFRDNSTAGNATLISEGGGNGGTVVVGAAIFYDHSNAGTAELRAKTGGGRFDFRHFSSAGDASLIIETSPGVVSGQIDFSNFAKAGTADFTIEPNGYIPLIHFADNASAEEAEFNLMDGSTGKLNFQGSSTAAQAKIDVGSTAALQFDSSSQVADATINIRRGGGMSIGTLGATGNATINLDGALVFNGARARLDVAGVGGAGNATITIGGGNGASAQGAYVVFDSGGHGQNATITVASGTVPGALGGNLDFSRGANGENARIINQQGGTINVWANRNYIPKTTFGSYEGAGTILLGGVELEIGSRNTDTAVSGPITDHVSVGLGGKLTKVGTGTLTLSGANTYTGLTTVNAGAVVVNGSNVGGAEVNSGGTLKGSGSLGGTVTVKAGGTLAPGVSPGILTVGNLTMNAGSLLQMELGGTTAGSEYDRIQSTGALAFGGALQISLVGGFIPTAGQSFDLFNWGSTSGTFTTLTLPTLAGLAWDTTQLYTAGVLSVTGVAGDFDLDGDVDGADLLVWQRGGSPTPNSAADLAIWKTNFGFGGATAAAAAVPEPSSKLLIVSTLAMFFASRRQRRICSID